MSDLIKENTDRLRERWSQAPTQRRRAYLLSALISVSAAGGILMWAVQPRYTRLYSQLQVEDAGAVIEQLKADKVAYRVNESAGTIEVPSGQVHELKMKMATAGLPQSTGPGWELFDKSPFGMTEFTQKLNYQRALQGELAKTITQLSQVQFCRVHLTMPERSLYDADKQAATASVVLSLAGARPLMKTEVKGIVHLVSRAVVGMKPENVTLIDARGNILSTDDMSTSGEEANPEQTNAQMDMQARVERKVQNEIQTMIDKALGPGQAIVRVRAKMDFSRRELNTETYTPAEEGRKDAKGVLNEEHTVEEIYAGRSASGGGSVPGVASNVAGLVSGLQGYRGEGGSPGGGYTRKETTARYNISKKVERLVSNPGDTTRISVAIVVNGQIDDAKREALTQAATAGAGLDLTHGDQISVVGIPFDTKVAQQEQKAMAEEERRELYSTGIKYALVLGALFIVFATTMRMVFRRPLPLAGAGTLPVLADSPALDGAPTVGQLLDEMEQTPASPPALAGTGDEADLESLLPLLSPHEERLRRLAGEDPEFVAKLLRSWLIGQGRR